MMFDLRSDLRNQRALVSTISTNTTTTGDIIDMQGHQTGAYFTVLCSAFTDGSYVVSLQHGDAANLSDAVDVVAPDLVGSNFTLTAATAAAAVINSLGYIGGKRYVRLKVVSTGVTTGATLIGSAVVRGDERPALQS
jgi:hypothetical protein